MGLLFGGIMALGGSSVASHETDVAETALEAATLNGAYVRNWLVRAPLSADSFEDLKISSLIGDLDRPPHEIDSAEMGDDVKAWWVRHIAHESIVDLSVFTPCGHETWAFVYTAVTAPRDMEAWLHLGTANSCMVFMNDAETKLKHLLAAAGFTAGEFQQQIRFREPLQLDHLIGSTTPDVFFSGDEDDVDDKGVCIYLDGMSSGLHGDPATASRDHEIRAWRRNNGYQVIEITAVELDDRDAMVRRFRKLARYLSGKEKAREIAEDCGWFYRNSAAWDSGS